MEWFRRNDTAAAAQLYVQASLLAEAGKEKKTLRKGKRLGETLCRLAALLTEANT